MSGPIVDAIVIGRNEGARLTACLQSLKGHFRHVVYVDSGSTDDSMATASKLGATAISLDVSVPFTAARARNFGFEHLRDDPPDYVQFIDGDCILDETWPRRATGFLSKTPSVVAVCGRRREIHPNASIFNALCDHEWDTPIGEAKACGGDAMFRYDALAAVGGFRESLIAGEEPELCIRLRQAGGSIWRIDSEMTRHDANMHKLSQWAQRARRAGYAYAEGAALHGAPPERHWVTEMRRALLWGVALPAVILIGMFITPWFAGLALIYPAQMIRLSQRTGSWSIGVFQTLAKFPESIGIADYWIRRLSRRKPNLIEYK